MNGLSVSDSARSWRNHVFLLLLIFLCSTLSTWAATQTLDSLTGSWLISWDRLGETNVDRLELSQAAEKVTGKAFNLEIEGTRTGDHFELKILRKNKNVWATLSGTIADQTLSGVLKADDLESTWTAERAPIRPATPQIHEFIPKVFYNHFSGAITPVLRVQPGDTVRTETVDAGGVDKDKVRRAPGGNPLTGPFYVVGAVRGDTLAVHFNRIQLNRDSAESGTALEESAVEPHYASPEQSGPELEGNWHLDREKGVATLAKPSEKLKGFSVPLQPMLGCVGVAPPRRQAIGSGDLGPYGGNMDYSQIKEGVTLYLPVFQPGALLFVGDGHAAEGDGELTGDALETSMDVEFTVDVIPAKRIGGPRAEDAQYLMALGIANSLPDALQRATTTLAEWLEQDYKLSRSEVALILGFAIRYDIAEVVDPHIHLVAKKVPWRTWAPAKT
jgi:amidase